MIRNRFAVFATALALAVGASARPALAQTWNFEDVDVSALNTGPIIQTKDGITAYVYPFIGTGDTGPFTKFSGNYAVFVSGVGSALSNGINVGFSVPVTSISFDWGAYGGGDPRNVLLFTFLGQTVAGITQLVASSSGDVDQYFYWSEGSASYNGSAFNQFALCRLNSENKCDRDANLYLDNLTVSTSTVPEPSTYALMAAGLAALGVVSRRRRRALEA